MKNNKNIEKKVEKKVANAIILIMLTVFATVFYILGNLGYAVEIESSPRHKTHTRDYIDDAVDYYGCPNSKRVKKLNLLKSKFKR